MQDYAINKTATKYSTYMTHEVLLQTNHYSYVCTANMLDESLCRCTWIASQLCNSQLGMLCCLSAAGPQTAAIHSRSFWSMETAVCADGCIAIAVFAFHMLHAYASVKNLSQRLAVVTFMKKEQGTGQPRGCSRDILQNSEFSSSLHQDRQGTYFVLNLDDASYE